MSASQVISSFQNDIDVVEDPFCVGGVQLLRRTARDTATGVDTVSWFNTSGAAVTPLAADITAATAGRCPTLGGTAQIVASCANVGRVAIGSTPANAEVLTPAAFSDTVRAVIDQVLRTAGCNDDRRDALLAQIVFGNTGTAVISRVAATAAGTVAAGAQSVSFLNVGTTNAQVLGVDLIPGQEVSFSGFYDEATRTYYRLPAIAYVGSATALLHISVVI